MLSKCFHGGMRFDRGIRYCNYHTFHAAWHWDTAGFFELKESTCLHSRDCEKTRLSHLLIETTCISKILQFKIGATKANEKLAIKSLVCFFEISLSLQYHFSIQRGKLCNILSFWKVLILSHMNLYRTKYCAELGNLKHANVMLHWDRQSDCVLRFGGVTASSNQD